MIGAGIALLAGSSALNAYGTYKTQQEVKKVLREYEQAVAEKTARDKAALRELAAIQSQFAADRVRAVDAYLKDLKQAYATQPVQEQLALSDALRQLGPRMEYESGYRGAAANQWGQTVDDQTNTATHLLAKQLLDQHRLSAIQEQEQYAGYRLNLSDLLRQARYLPIERRMQLAQALRDIDWQKQMAALQAKLNKAQMAGAWYQLLGSTGTQVGGMMLTAGVAQGGGATTA